MDWAHVQSSKVQNSLRCTTKRVTICRLQLPLGQREVIYLRSTLGHKLLKCTASSFRPAGHLVAEPSRCSAAQTGKGKQLPLNCY